MAKSLISKPNKEGSVPSETKSFALPSRKQAIDFFFSEPRLQILYAERARIGFQDFENGKSRTYPVHLNTHADIAEFIFNQRSVKVDTVNSVAEKFLSMCIHGSNSQSDKRKREEAEILRDFEKMKRIKPKQVAKVAPKASAKPKDKVSPAVGVKEKVSDIPVVVGKYNIRGRDRKMQLSYDVLSAPNFLSFFPHPRVSIFSSNGGLHDASCQICVQIGHYNSAKSDGVARKLDLGQRAWVATLHDITDAEGYIPAGMVSALLEVKRTKSETTMEVVADMGTPIVSERTLARDDPSGWGDSKSEEQ